MSAANNETPNVKGPTEQTRALIGGAFLILIGVLSLVGQFFQGDWLSFLVLPVLAAIFLVWGAVTRQAGLLIPAGVLGGIALGVTLERTMPGLQGQASGGVIVLSMSLGFAAITVLTKILTSSAHWWALVVAAILAVVGGALLAGGAALQMLTLAGQVWPLILIGLGLYIILQRRGTGDGGK